jgi:hypothetical protein
MGERVTSAAGAEQIADENARRLGRIAPYHT